MTLVAFSPLAMSFHSPLSKAWQPHHALWRSPDTTTARRARRAAACPQHPASQRKPKHKMRSRRGAKVKQPIPNCPSCHKAAPEAVRRQCIARIPPAHEKHGEQNCWCLMAPGRLLTHCMWLNMKGRPAGRSSHKPHDSHLRLGSSPPGLRWKGRTPNPTPRNHHSVLREVFPFQVLSFPGACWFH